MMMIRAAETQPPLPCAWTAAAASPPGCLHRGPTHAALRRCGFLMHTYGVFAVHGLGLGCAAAEGGRGVG